jgi:hypothetical protein
LIIVLGLSIAPLTYPFLPFSAERLHRLLGYDDSLLSHGWQVERLTAGTVN